MRALADSIYDAANAREERGDAAEADLLGIGAPEARASGSGGSPGDLVEADFAPAKTWFDKRRAKVLEAKDSWTGWLEELDGVRTRP